MEMSLGAGDTYQMIDGMRFTCIAVEGGRAVISVYKPGHSLSGRLERLEEEKEPVTTSVPDAFMRAFA